MLSSCGLAAAINAISHQISNEDVSRFIVEQQHMNRSTYNIHYEPFDLILKVLFKVGAGVTVETVAKNS